MRIIVPGFSGLNKRLAPQRLEDSEATAALNCDFRTGDLQGFLGDADLSPPVDVGAPSGAYTLFQYDATRLIAQPGVYDFARSPTFYQDTYNRAFLSVYPAASSDYVKLIDKDTVLTGYQVDTVAAKALGVLVPGAIGMLTHAVNSGSIASVVLHNAPVGGSAQTTDLTAIHCDADHGLAANTVVLIDYAGIPATPYKVLPDATDPKLFRLQGAALRTRACQLVFTKVGTTGHVQLNKDSHGLLDGDQVLVYYDYARTSNLMTFNVAKVFTVFDRKANNFKLSLDGTTEYTWDTTAGGYYSFPNGSPVSRDGCRMVIVSSGGNPIGFTPASGSQDAIMSVGADPDEVSYALTLATDSAGSWNIAATADAVRTRAYLTTFINKYGDESAPGIATETFEVVPGSPVTFPVAALPYPVDVHNHEPISGWRLYRTDALGTWRFLEEIAVAGSADSPEYIDTKLDTELGEQLATEGWLPPPGGLTGLISAPNGVIVGFRDKTIIPSVPFAPYAFPIAYQTATDYPIVGLVSTSAGVAVLTDGLPYLLIGTDPASWSIQKLEVPQACVSHRSIVDMGDFGIYASPDGLVAIEGSTVKVLTEEIMTRAQWQAYNPSTIVAEHCEGRYVATWQPASGPRQGFVFDPRTGSFTDTTLAALALYGDLQTGSLLLLMPDGTVKRWNQGSTRGAFQWRSKLFLAPRPTNFGAMQVLMPDYTQATTVQLWVAGVPVFVDGLGASTPKTLDSATPFRLPSGYLAREYQIELAGVGTVQAVGIANTIDELRDEP